MTRAPLRLDSHVADAQAEDVEFLVATGTLLADACRRVGVDPDLLTKRAERAGRVTRGGRP